MRLRFARAFSGGEWLGLFAVATLLGGCRPDLGECDTDTAYEVIYRDDPLGTGLPAYAGQALINQSCGGGSYCHSENLDELANRDGAPYGLDFDLRLVLNDSAAEVERLRRAQRDVWAYRRRIYALVRDGVMPTKVPRFNDAGVLEGYDGLNVVHYAAFPDSPEAIKSPEGREILRNWLACGSPVVERTADDRPPGVVPVGTVVPVQVACPDGLRGCGGACVNVSANQEHCGGCDQPCGVGQTCTDGSCACDPGLVACGSDCVDTATDFHHCGACGQTCATGEVCAGMCLTGGCPGGTEDCGGSCVDTVTSVQHCGACGNACPAGAGCFDGACMCNDSALTVCAGACVDTVTNSLHCGGCGSVCPAGAACSGGQCVCDDSALTFCDGVCVDSQTSSAHCGSCGQACMLGEVCEAGACVSCSAGIGFASDVQPIFTDRCAGSMCHVGARRPAGGMALDPGQAYGNLVGVPANGCTDGHIRVVPGLPDESYLLNKLRGMNMCAGNRMPLNDPPLDAPTMSILERWICGGAENN